MAIRVVLAVPYLAAAAAVTAVLVCLLINTMPVPVIRVMLDLLGPRAILVLLGMARIVAVLVAVVVLVQPVMLGTPVRVQLLATQVTQVPMEIKEPLVILVMLALAVMSALIQPLVIL